MIPGQLRVYVWADHKKPLVHNIALDYDVVITTFSRLSAKSSQKKISVFLCKFIGSELFLMKVGPSLNLTNKLQSRRSLHLKCRLLRSFT